MLVQSCTLKYRMYNSRGQRTLPKADPNSHLLSSIAFITVKGPLTNTGLSKARQQDLRIVELETQYSDVENTYQENAGTPCDTRC